MTTNTYAHKGNPLDTQQRGVDICFDHVGLRYGRNPEVFKDISFSMAQGSLNFVTGPSGAGKTSLLKMMYLNLRPSRGLISVFGQDCSRLQPNSILALKRRMGIVLQNFQLVDHLSVFENVALPLRVTGQKYEAYAGDVFSLLKWIGLGERIHALPATLSGGEAQRAAIARAIIAKPDVLIADEPTGNLDTEIGRRLIHLFTELHRQGSTVIIATHDRTLITPDADILEVSHQTLIHKKGGAL
ncbi:MAG: ATP-binding cassette domain-containing protein [Robiginitomaculum sp.]|nr:ATP-binding cassette domain-containing protein [Robiginitomaculum sp.]